MINPLFACWPAPNNSLCLGPLNAKQERSNGSSKTRTKRLATLTRKGLCLIVSARLGRLQNPPSASEYHIRQLKVSLIPCCSWFCIYYIHFKHSFAGSLNNKTREEQNSPPLTMEGQYRFGSPPPENDNNDDADQSFLVLEALLGGSGTGHLEKTCHSIVAAELGFELGELEKRLKLTGDALDKLILAGLDVNKAFQRSPSDPITKAFFLTYRRKDGGDDDLIVKEIISLFREDETNNAMLDLFSLLFEVEKVEGFEFMEPYVTKEPPTKLVTTLNKFFSRAELCDLEDVFNLTDRKLELQELDDLLPKAASLLSGVKNKTKAFKKEVLILRYLAFRNLSRTSLLTSIDSSLESLYSELLSGCLGPIDYDQLMELCESGIDQNRLQIVTGHYDDIIPPEIIVESVVKLLEERLDNNEETPSMGENHPVDPELQQQVSEVLMRYEPRWRNSLNKYLAYWYVRAGCLKTFYRSRVHSLRPILRCFFMWGRTNDLFPVPARDVLKAESDRNKRQRSKEMYDLLIKCRLSKVRDAARTYLVMRDLLDGSGPQSLVALSCAGLGTGTREYGCLFWGFMELLVTGRDMREFLQALT